MKRLRLVSPGTLSRLFQDAADAWKRLDYQQTIELLQRAAKLDPANPAIHLDLGRAYGLRFDYPNAERCLDQACRVSPRLAETSAEAGRRCQEFGNPMLAERFFHRAASAKNATPEVFVALAEIHERRAQLDQAADFAQRALKLDASNPSAHLTLARLDRLANRLPEAENRVRSLITNNRADPWLRARAWYELAEILDRSARYDDAFQALLEAKTIIRPAAANHAATLQRIQARVRQLEETVTAATLQRWAAAADSFPSRRFAILCGHPRSGTTLLEQSLAGHPDIITAEETHILHDEAYLPLCRGFAPDASILDVLEAAPISQLRESRENYFRFTELLLGQTLDGKLLVDKNPALNVLIPAAARIFPEAKFLIALRDPRDVCLSCFFQPLAPNPVNSAYLSLETTIAQYLSVIGFWRALLPRLANPFLEVRYEDVVDNLEAQSRRVLAFLGADWDDRVLRFDEQARKKSLRSPSYAEVARPLTKRAVGRWQNYRRHLEPYLARLEPMLQVLGYA